MYTKIAAIVSNAKGRFECHKKYIYHGDSEKKRQGVKKGNRGKKESKK